MIENLQRQRKVALKAHLISASSSIKFSSYFTVLWKTKDSMISIQTTKSEVRQGQTIFNQALTLQLNVLFDQASKKYLKCQTQMNLRLISKAKQNDQPKLVGKIALQVSSILNHPQKQGVILEYPLQFCSVNAVINLSFEVIYFQNNQEQKFCKMNNATPPKSPPTTSFIKSNSILQKSVFDKANQKISLGTLKRLNIIQQGQKKMISLEQFNKIKDQFNQLQIHNLQLVKQKQILQNNLIQSFQNLKNFQSELNVSKKQNQRLCEQLRKKIDEIVQIHLELSEIKQLNSQKSLQIAVNHGEINKINILRQQIKFLQGQKKDSGVKVKELQKLCMQLKNQKSTIQVEIKNYKDQILTLNIQLESSLRNIELLQQTHNQSQIKTSQRQSLLQNQLKQQRQVRTRLQEKIKKNKIQLSNLDSKLLNQQKLRLQTQNQILNIETIKSKEEERITELESILLNNQDELKILRSTKKQLLQQIAKKQTIQEQLRLLLSKQKQQLIIYQTEKNNLVEEVYSLKENNLLLSEQILSQKSKISDLQELLLINNQIKFKELQELNDNNKNSQRKIQQIEQRNRSIQESNKFCKEKLQVYQNQINQRQTLVERLQKGLSKQMKISQDKNNKLIQSLSIIQNYSQGHIILQRDLNALNDIVTLSQINQVKYKNKIGDLQLQLYEILTVHQCLQSQYTELQIQNERKSLQADSALNEAQATLESQRNSLKEMKQYVQNLQAQIYRLSSQIQTLENQKKQLVQNSKLLEQKCFERQRSWSLKQKQHSEIIQGFHSQIERFKQILKFTQLQFSQKEKQINAIEEIKCVMATQIASEQREKQLLIEKIFVYQKQLLSYKQELQNFNQLLNTKSDQLQKEKIKFEDLREIFTLSQNQKQKEKELYQRIKAEQAEKDQKYTEEIKNSQNQLQIKLLQIQNLKGQIYCLKCQIATKETKMNANQDEKNQKNQLSKQYHLQQLLQEKEKQITQLQEEIDRISSQANKVYDLIEQVEAYRQELQLHDEERASLQTLEKQRNSQISQLRQYNCKLKIQILTLTQRMKQLEVNLYVSEKSKQEKMQTHYQFQTIQKKSEEKIELPDEDLVLEIADLKLKIKDLQDKNYVLQLELEDKQEKHVVDLIDQHIRLSKPEFSENNLARSHSRINKEVFPDFLQTCQVLKQILKNRQTMSLSSEKDQTSLNKLHIEDIPRYSQTVSLELQKIKSQLLKSEKRVNVSQLFKNCQNSIKNLCAFVQEYSSYQ